MSEARRKSNEELETRLAALENVEFEVTEKILNAFVTNVSDSVVSDLTFYNLIIGKQYRIDGQVQIRVDDGGSGKLVGYMGVSTILLKAEYNASSGAVGIVTSGVTSGTFTATSDTITFKATVASAVRTIQGNSTKDATWMSLTKLN